MRLEGTRYQLKSRLGQHALAIRGHHEAKASLDGSALGLCDTRVGARSSAQTE